VSDDFLNVSVSRFLELTAAREPAPGGGSAAAMTVALAGGLAAMVARFSADHLEDATDFAIQADTLWGEAAPLAQADAAAYASVLEAGRTGEGIQEALLEAADVPLSIAETGAAIAELGAHLAENGNPNLRGDALAAVLLAEAGVRVAANLVRINLQSAGLEDGRLQRAQGLLRSAAEAREATER
jgi:formiminotetrahydrofolate cyclodeaminase